MIGLDRGLNPPEPPTHGTCERCGDILDYGDMEKIGGLYFCEMCADIVRMEADGEN